MRRGLELKFISHVDGVRPQGVLICVTKYSFQDDDQENGDNQVTYFVHVICTYGMEKITQWRLPKDFALKYQFTGQCLINLIYLK